VDLLTIIVGSVDIGGLVYHHCLFFRTNIDGQQVHQYQQNKQ
jgi:hypothetical protein